MCFVGPQSIHDEDKAMDSLHSSPVVGAMQRDTVELERVRERGGYRHGSPGEQFRKLISQ